MCVIAKEHIIWNWNFIHALTLTKIIPIFKVVDIFHVSFCYFSFHKTASDLIFTKRSK